MSSPEPPTPSRPARRTGPRVVSSALSLDEPRLITDILRSQDNLSEVARLSQHATEGYIHVSSLLNFCARQYAIAGGSNELHVNRVTGGHRVMWELGRAAEKHVRRQFIRAMDRRYLYGRWSCLCERASHIGFHDPSTPSCTTCLGPQEHYHEQPLFDHDACIVGSCDMPILVGSAILPVEIKSTDRTAEELAKMTEPEVNHVLQVGGYYRLYRQNAAEIGYDVHAQCRVIYVQKRFKYGDPYREFIVPACDLDPSGVMARAWEDARILAQAVDRGVLPTRICGDRRITRAKECPVMGHCFNARS